MKRAVSERRVLVLAAALLSSIGLLGLVAGSAAGATVRTFSFGGNNLVASFESSDECTARSGFVMASDRTEREGNAGPSRGLSALIAISETDLCGGTAGTERAFFGRADLDVEVFEVRGDWASRH